MPSLPNYSTITVVGLGLIGGSLALALKRAGFKGKILGVSRPQSLEEGRRAGAIDEGFPYEELGIVARRSDLIVLSTPIVRIAELIGELGEIGGDLRPGTVITDVGSTKGSILECAAANLPEHVVFIGGHPLAGSELQGVTSADPFLFQNAYYVLTPSAGSPQPEVDRLSGVIGLTGARVLVLPAAQHDRVAAAISHLPQLLAVTLVNSLETLEGLGGIATHLAAGGFRDMTRIASSPFAIWKDIVETNRNEIEDAIDRFVSLLRSETAQLDENRLDTAFEKAARTRGAIPPDTKGFVHRLWDILVEVEDRPGMVLGVVEPLTKKGLNIKDIEVVKVREGEGGTMRLSFDTREIALQALDELSGQGFRSRLRE